MRVETTSLPGVLLIEPDVHGDERGYLSEVFRASDYERAGIPTAFPQDNLSMSHAGVLRGLHYQHPRGQAKLITVIAGEIHDVIVDVRRDAPTFGRWFGVRLSGARLRQLWVPAGFAHGFCVVHGPAWVSYKCSEYFVPGNERAVRWDDPQIGIDWPIDAPLLSPRDAAAPLLADIPRAALPQG